MHQNPGFVNEKEFIFRLNGHKVGDLSNNLKYIVKEVYGFYKDDEVVYAGLVDNYQKPDIYIEFRGIRKYISLKSGNASTVAEENIKLFIQHLRKCNVSTRSLKTILYYHFGDGTLNGTGKNRMDYNVLRVKLNVAIRELNRELNNNKQFIKDFVVRSMFKGTNPDNIEADYIYFGNVDYGILCSKTQILKHIDRRSWDYMDNPHIGPLQFRPHARYVHTKITSEKRRWAVDIYRANLCADLTYISNRYDG
jgi:hypothetical protein